jgi:imidazolonepropionase-like amidohydrolase
MPLFVAAVLFWAIQEQGATVIAQYAAENTDLDAFGFTMPASWFQSVGSLVLPRRGRQRAPGPDAGVRIAMGTDAPLYPHGENLMELELLVQQGLSPAEALHAATLSAAHLMGLDATLGSL